MKKFFKYIIIALFIYYFLFKNQEKLSNTCNTNLCNNKIKEFVIDNNWSFNDSTNKFKECNGCESKWFRSVENKTSNNGKIWKKHLNKTIAFNDIMI